MDTVINDLVSQRQMEILIGPVVFKNFLLNKDGRFYMMRKLATHTYACGSPLNSPKQARKTFQWTKILRFTWLLIRNLMIFLVYYHKIKKKYHWLWKHMQTVKYFHCLQSSHHCCSCFRCSFLWCLHLSLHVFTSLQHLSHFFLQVNCLPQLTQIFASWRIFELIKVVKYCSSFTFHLPISNTLNVLSVSTCLESSDWTSTPFLCLIF